MTPPKIVEGAAVGTVDIAGDLEAITEEVAVECIAIYDLVWNTFNETFTQAMTLEEVKSVLANITEDAMQQMMMQQPQMAAAIIEESSRIARAETS